MIEISPAEKIWFGYSNDFGWVIYDRKIFKNRLGTKEKEILIIKCSDWSSYDELKKIFEEKKLYTYVNNYIEKQEDDEVETEARELFNQYLEIHRENILDKYEALDVEEKRRKFFEKQNLPYKGFKKSLQTKNRRTSFDWYCKNPVDNFLDFECEACGWIICNKCGACKLGGCN